VADEPFSRGWDDEITDVNQEWLKTPEGREWLYTDDGIAWLGSTEGRWWSQGDDARRWYEEEAQEGWAAYFSGKNTWPRPSTYLTPENAPQIGSRVRLKKEAQTLGGDAFEDGDEALVYQLTFNPIGSVTVSLRTPDGRKCVALRPEDYEELGPAG
jgi:hypothetical protein